MPSWGSRPVRKTVKETEERSMKDRMQLDETQMEEIVGGKFTFFPDGGEMKCTVTGYGTFETSKSGPVQYIMLRQANPGLSEDEYFQMCIAQHIIW